MRGAYSRTAGPVERRNAHNDAVVLRARTLGIYMTADEVHEQLAREGHDVRADMIRHWLLGTRRLAVGWPDREQVHARIERITARARTFMRRGYTLRESVDHLRDEGHTVWFEELAKWVREECA